MKRQTSLYHKEICRIGKRCRDAITSKNEIQKENEKTDTVSPPRNRISLHKHSQVNQVCKHANINIKYRMTEKNVYI